MVKFSSGNFDGLPRRTVLLGSVGGALVLAGLSPQAAADAVAWQDEAEAVGSDLTGIEAVVVLDIEDEMRAAWASGGVPDAIREVVARLASCPRILRGCAARFRGFGGDWLPVAEQFERAAGEAD